MHLVAQKIDFTLGMMISSVYSRLCMYMSLILLTSLLVVYLLAAYILVERLFDYVPLVVPAPYAIALNPVIRLGE